MASLSRFGNNVTRTCSYETWSTGKLNISLKNRIPECFVKMFFKRKIIINKHINACHTLLNLFSKKFVKCKAMYRVLSNSSYMYIYTHEIENVQIGWYFLTTVFTLQKGVKRFIYVARKEKKPYLMVMSVVRQLK